jgi:hypothetical protein
MYFFFVETKGLTLEELDVVFAAENPREASLAAGKMQAEIIRENKASQV